MSRAEREIAARDATIQTLTSALMLVVETINRTKSRVPPEAAPVFRDLDIAAASCLAFLGGSTLALLPDLGAGKDPAPQPGTTEVWPLVVSEVEGSIRDDIGRFVVEDMRARDAFGRQESGVPLTVENGWSARDALVAEYREDLDALAYRRLRLELLRRGGEEPDATEIMLYRTRLNFLAQLRRLIAVGDMLASLPILDLAAPTPDGGDNAGVE